MEEIRVGSDCRIYLQKLAVMCCSANQFSRLVQYNVKDWYFGHFHVGKTGRMRSCNWTALHCADKFHGNWWCEVR